MLYTVTKINWCVFRLNKYLQYYLQVHYFENKVVINYQILAQPPYTPALLRYI